MRSNTPTLCPAARREFVVDLLARRLLALASRGILLELDEGEPEPLSAATPAATRALRTMRRTDGAR